MGGRSGQSTGSSTGGMTFAYSASDADVPIGEISASNSDYAWLKINGIDEQNTENYQKFINSYTRNGYSVNKNIVDGKLNANDIKYIKGLNASLDKIASTEGTFERGMRVTKGSRTEKLVNLLLKNQGRNITMTTFLSTTSDKTTAKNFSGTNVGTPAIFTVKGKNGKSVEKLSSFTSEKEFVFKAGTKFKVNSAEKVFDAVYGKEVFKISLTEKP